MWEWVFELVDKQRSVSKSSNSEDHYIQKSTRNVTKSERVSDFEAETCDEPRQSVVAESSTACDGDRDSVALLQEMFPGVTEQTVSGALVRCKGDLELAIQELLAQSETKMLRDRKKEVRKNILFSQKLLLVKVDHFASKTFADDEEEEEEEGHSDLLYDSSHWGVKGQLYLISVFYSVYITVCYTLRPYGLGQTNTRMDKNLWINLSWKGTVLHNLRS